MEGLIPVVYKAIKRSKTRRQYECLSSGAAQSYNIPDFYVSSQNYVNTESPSEKIAGFHAERNDHRRHKSVGDYSNQFFSVEDRVKGAGSPPLPPKKLVRKGMLFCSLLAASLFPPFVLIRSLQLGRALTKLNQGITEANNFHQLMTFFHFGSEADNNLPACKYSCFICSYGSGILIPLFGKDNQSSCPVEGDGSTTPFGSTDFILASRETSA
ncbi:hypothetical protein CK203_052175 [Vitis vinifera]|uniref:Uncharacterized protein n=1 Tax=Vitis vinifera TaxID=29760 RepID=A0A438GA65_VITVI|nr:hypothetical protein CK203_052175 [Vitis vinifera]